MNEIEKQEFLTSNKANMIQARDAIYSMNNAKIYDYIDAMKESKRINEEVALATEQLTEKILSQVDAATALEYAEDPSKIKKIIESLASVRTEDGYASEILMSDDYDLKEKLQAYEEALVALKGDAEALKALQETFNEFKLFQELNDEAIDFIDAANLSYDQINQLHDITRQLNKEWSDIGVTIDEDADTIFQNLLNDMSTSGGDISSSINTVFGTYLDEIADMGED